MTKGKYTTEFDAVCPHCHRINELHSHPSGRSPEEGDFSMCWRCRGLSRYWQPSWTDRLILRAATPEETQEAMEIPEYSKILQLHGESATPTELLDALASDLETEQP